MADNGLDEAKNALKIADHMAYITYPVLKEKRLLVKIIEQLNKALTKTVSLIVAHEYAQKRIKTYSDPRLNFDSFKSCAVRYGINQGHIGAIKQVSELAEMHKRSPMEFVRREKLVIMTDSMQIEDITLERIKVLLSLSKEMINKAQMQFEKDKSPGSADKDRKRSFFYY